MEQIDIKLWYIIRTMGVANKNPAFFVTVPHFIIMLFIKRG